MLFDMKQLLFWFFAPFIITLLLILGGIFLFHYIRYRKSTYSKIAGNRFLRALFDAGTAGEYAVVRVLEKLPVTQMLLTNVYVPKADGGTSESDILFLTEFGIFVVESKNYRGWIFGSCDDYEWLQVFGSDRKYPFYNPAKQNDGHIRALSAYLQVERAYFRSVIVFGDKCNLQHVSMWKGGPLILHRRSLSKALKRQIKRMPKRFTAAEIAALYGRLEPHSSVSVETKRRHIASVSKHRPY